MISKPPLLLLSTRVDLVSFVISLAAIYISTWAPTKRYTFGYHRAEVMGAFFSILLIYALTAVLLYEAVERVQNPKPIQGWVMFGVALAGVGINLVYVSYEVVYVV